jgi:hypothetical protein
LTKAHHRTWIVAGAAVALLTAAPAGWSAQAQTSTPQTGEAALHAAYRQSITDARHGRYIEASFGLLARLEVHGAEEIKDSDVFDQWSQVMSCMTALPTFNPAKSAAFHVPDSQIAQLREAEASAAIPEITRRARKTRLVILDENHLDPRGRAFGLEVARALRPLGFTVLAFEALGPDAEDAKSSAKMQQLSADGYVRQASGYYLDDPVFADFLRQSLSLGYKLVSYESAHFQSVSDPQEAQERREQDQADNVIRRALESHPGAKVLVYVGEHHVAESAIAAETRKFRFLAQRLKETTGVDPLTIDQAGLSPVPMNRPNAELYDIAVSRAHGESVVLMRHGQPLSVGLMAGSVDLQVVHPRPARIGGRPAWLLKMSRRLSAIPARYLPESGTRLVQAFIASEANDAIPIDQVLVSAGRPAPGLMLPPNISIRYATQDVPAKYQDE